MCEDIRNMQWKVTSVRTACQVIAVEPPAALRTGYYEEKPK
jgi:hypothetical protein